MRKKKSTKRIIHVLLFVILPIAAGICILLNTFKDNIIFFVTPSELLITDKNYNMKKIRIGGMVVKNSIYKSIEKTTFSITDTKKSILIEYSGILPTLFREGQGVVTEGIYIQAANTLIADKVLAKHDEIYMSKDKYDKSHDECLYQDQSLITH